MKPLDILIGVIVMVVWGMNFAFGKLAMAEFPPMMLIGLRYLLTALLLIPFLKPQGMKFAHIFALSMTLGVLHFAFMFTGLQGTDASLAAIAAQIQVPFAVILAVFFFRERPTRKQILGIAVAFVGVAMLAGAPKTSSSLFHLGLVIVAALLWGLAHIQVKWMGAVNPFVLNAWMSVLAAPMMLVASFAIEDGQWEALQSAGFAGWGGVVYMALGVTIFGYGLWYRILQKYDVSQTMPLTILAPLVGAGAGIVILGEHMDAFQLAGAALTIVGVGAVTTGGKAKAKVEAEG
ncbi:EamA family transporter [Nisaea acidiphila]|uniref:EamA family transporter n=1 Tax=Nisaea acidiphila TaxID=1862145 RepID=A0A9J7AV94_9PROT|nr:EamA family transporter [Nisaea acidiphila]UUX51248.1 EamA family transporter [Nisaea acidiphila]